MQANNIRNGIAFKNKKYIKNIPFYRGEIKKSKKKKKFLTNARILSELLIINFQENFHFFQKI